MKSIKSILIYGGILASILATNQLQAATASIALPASGATGVSNAIQGAFRLVSVTISAPSTIAPSVSFFDSVYSTFQRTNASYVSVISYATNYITTWTNFYGITNNITNLALVDVNFTNAAASNTIASTFIAVTPTNTTTVYNNLNLTFNNGLWITNTATGSGNTTLTITYQQ